MSNAWPHASPASPVPGCAHEDRAALQVLDDLGIGLHARVVRVDEDVPEAPGHAFLLVGIEREWVPKSVGHSLYVRPTIIASEAFLGVRPAKSYIYFVILSPVGAYYPEGMAPVKILVVDQYVRAVEGGVGAAKTSGNYAASLFASDEAKHEGFTQVLWLDGVHRKYLDEVGTMNIMVKIGDEIITPPLTGTILPGVTRDSALTLMRKWGLKVSERQVSIDEVVEALITDDRARLLSNDDRS